MPSTDCPCLRSFLAAAQDESDPRYVILWDKLGLGAAPLRVTLPEFLWLEMFDGERTFNTVIAAAAGNRAYRVEYWKDGAWVVAVEQHDSPDADAFTTSRFSAVTSQHDRFAKSGAGRESSGRRSSEL